MNNDVGLYDDLLQEETTAEYITKLETQLKDLIEKLKELESALTDCEQQKDKLAKENHDLLKKYKCLQRNSSSLFKTARSEIERKDNTLKEIRAEYDNLAFRRNKINSHDRHNVGRNIRRSPNRTHSQRNNHNHRPHHKADRDFEKSYKERRNSSSTRDKDKTDRRWKSDLIQSTDRSNSRPPRPQVSDNNNLHRRKNDRTELFIPQETEFQRRRRERMEKLFSSQENEIRSPRPGEIEKPSSVTQNVPVPVPVPVPNQEIVKMPSKDLITSEKTNSRPERKRPFEKKSISPLNKESISPFNKDSISLMKKKQPISQDNNKPLLKYPTEPEKRICTNLKTKTESYERCKNDKPIMEKAKIISPENCKNIKLQSKPKIPLTIPIAENLKQTNGILEKKSIPQNILQFSFNSLPNDTPRKILNGEISGFPLKYSELITPLKETPDQLKKIMKNITETNNNPVIPMLNEIRVLDKQNDTIHRNEKESISNSKEIVIDQSPLKNCGIIQIKSYCEETKSDKPTVLSEITSSVIVSEVEHGVFSRKGRKRPAFQSITHILKKADLPVS